MLPLRNEHLIQLRRQLKLLPRVSSDSAPGHFHRVSFLPCTPPSPPSSPSPSIRFIRDFRSQNSLVPNARSFHASIATAKGLQPDSANPAPPKAYNRADTGQADTNHVAQPAVISMDEYHEIADQYIEELVTRLEEKAEDGLSGSEVEYSVSSPLICSFWNSFFISAYDINTRDVGL